MTFSKAMSFGTESAREFKMFLQKILPSLLTILSFLVHLSSQWPAVKNTTDLNKKEDFIDLTKIFLWDYYDE